jgi:Protein tyrosine and serine/threonine kinase
MDFCLRPLLVMCAGTGALATLVAFRRCALGAGQRSRLCAGMSPSAQQSRTSPYRQRRCRVRLSPLAEGSAGRCPLPTYNQEIDNLTPCRGNPYIVQGRTEEKTLRLVFERHPRDLLLAAMLACPEDRVLNIKRWMLQIVEGVSFMHCLGLTHRDLAARNILVCKPVTVDNFQECDAVVPDPVVLCDLQCRHASLVALEVCNDGHFAPSNDVHGLRVVLCFDNPIVPPQAPFDIIVMECMKEDPNHSREIESYAGGYQY